MEYFTVVLDFIQSSDLLHTNHLMVCEALSGGDAKSKLRNVSYQPAKTGQMLSMKYNGTTIYVRRVVENSTHIRHNEKSVQMEKLVLSVAGSDTSVIKLLIQNAIDRANENAASNIRIFAYSEDWTGTWDKIASRPPRDFDSVILDKSLSWEILQDMQTFTQSEHWYTAMGIPYRRGYLFHGPPGNGKTSICQVLAGAMRLDIRVLSLTSTQLSDMRLIHLMRTIPSRSLILLEDVDAVFIGREKANPDANKLTFSGLLNAIDGIVSQEGNIFIMTTNHIERLDPALIRPGRCDVKLEVCNASRGQLVAMFVRFFPGREADAETFASRIPEGEVSMAQIQNHLVEHKHSPEKAIEAAAHLKAACEGPMIVPSSRDRPMCDFVV
jgi:chaperone BCS1